MASHGKSGTRAQGLTATAPCDAWLAAIPNKRTRRLYEWDVRRFLAFTGIDAAAVASVTEADVAAWRADLHAQGLAESSITRKLGALCSLFAYLVSEGLAAHNPVKAERTRWNPRRQRKKEVIRDDCMPWRGWLASLRTHKTRDGYLSDVRAFADFLGIAAAEELLSARPEDVAAWRAHLDQEGLRPGSVARKLAALSSVYGYLRKRKMVSGNPVRVMRAECSEA